MSGYANEFDIDEKATNRINKSMALAKVIRTHKSDFDMDDEGMKAIFDLAMDASKPISTNFVVKKNENSS